MHRTSFGHRNVVFTFTAIAALVGSARTASADAVTDWNEVTIEATKGFNGSSGAGVTLDSNLGTRIEAIEARAVFDAVNSIAEFSSGSYYYYSATNTGSPDAAAAQAAHDVILGTLPDPSTDTTADARWTPVRAWVDQHLDDYLAALGVSASDGGITAGHAAASAALAARKLDNSAPVTTYGASLTPTSNPGIGLWRQSNAAAVYVDPTTGVPTGFDATGAIQGRPGIDLNWRDVTPFSLSTPQRSSLESSVPLSPAVGSPEYAAELGYVKSHGQDSAPASVRSADQTAQALFYKQDAEIFVNELARIASGARGLSLDDDARLFALLDDVLADARITAFASKYDQKFWRPITAINANADGSVTRYTWHPVAATPSHPSNTAGHSTTGAAGAEVLRSFFGSDKIRPDGAAVTLGTLPWLVGTNSGTGVTTNRSVSTFSQVQLENGASRLYLGAHFGWDNLQGQLLGLAVADTILSHSNDPAADGVSAKDSAVSFLKIASALLSKPDLYGLFGKNTVNGGH